MIARLFWFKFKKSRKNIFIMRSAGMESVSMPRHTCSTTQPMMSVGSAALYVQSWINKLHIVLTNYSNQLWTQVSDYCIQLQTTQKVIASCGSFSVWVLGHEQAYRSSSNKVSQSAKFSLDVRYSASIFPVRCLALLVLEDESRRSDRTFNSFAIHFEIEFNYTEVFQVLLDQASLANLFEKQIPSSGKLAQH
jgi:hypothetical protein